MFREKVHLPINSAGTAGKCWMVKKNLALKLTQGVALTKEETDIGVDANDSGEPWTPSYSTDTSIPTNVRSTGSWYLSSYSQYGVYYAWDAATAGWTSGAHMANSPRSICPKGWRLPTSGKDGMQWDSAPVGEFNELYVAYGGSLSQFVNAGEWQKGGYIEVNSLSSEGAGYYWSSTTCSTYSTPRGAYALRFDSSRIYPSYDIYFSYAYSVRCVARGDE